MHRRRARSGAIDRRHRRAGPQASVDPVEAEDAPAEQAEASSDGLVTASWAYPAQNVGEELTTVQIGPLSVQVNDSGRLPATKDQFFSDGTQAMTEGEPVVYLTWTVTNTSDEPVPMSASMVSVRASFNHRTLGYDSHAGFRTLGISPVAASEYREDGIYPLGPGESFTAGTNFPLNDIDVLDLNMSWTPTSESGQLHDLREELQTSVTLAR